MSRHHRALNRRQWERCRVKVLERAAWRCESCGKAGKLEVDHRVPLALDPEQDPYDPDGCQALCRGCHADKSRGERGEDPARAAWRAYLSSLFDT